MQYMKEVHEVGLTEIVLPGFRALLASLLCSIPSMSVG